MTIPTLTLDDLRLLYVALGCAYPHLTDFDSIIKLSMIQNKFGSAIADLELEEQAVAQGIMKAGTNG